MKNTTFNCKINTITSIKVIITMKKINPLDEKTV